MNFGDRCREVIARFGGPKPLAERLSKPVSTVNNWPITGFPGKWHLRLLREAEQDNIPLTRDELEALSTTRRRNGGAR